MNGTPSHWDAATQRYFLKKVPSAEVAERQIARAENIRMFVCVHLKIEPPTIVWLCPTPPTSKRGALKQDYQEELDDIVRLGRDTTGGYTPSNFSLHEIWIRSDLTQFPNLEFGVAHELRHVAQKRLCPSVYWDEARAEGDAYPYGYHILRRYLESTRHLTEDAWRNIETTEAVARESYRKNYPNGRYAMIPLAPAT